QWSRRRTARLSWCRPEPGGELGERLAFAQVDQDQEGLLPGVQLPPQRADRDPVAADDPGREGEGLRRQRQRGTVEQHGSPWWQSGSWLTASSTRGFLVPGAGAPLRDQMVTNPSQPG